MITQKHRFYSGKGTSLEIVHIKRRVKKKRATVFVVCFSQQAIRGNKISESMIMNFFRKYFQGIK